MDEYVKLSFEFAKNIAELLITISISVISIMITFREKFIINLGLSSKILISMSWLLYFISICFSIGTIMCMAGVIDNSRTDTYQIVQSNNGNIKVVNSYPVLAKNTTSGETLRFIKSDTVLVKLLRKSDDKPSIYAKNITFTALWMIGSFLVATFIVIVIGIIVMWGNEKSSSYKHSRSQLLK